MNQVTEEVRAKAEVYHGDALCKEKSREALKEIRLPQGLLPLDDIEECGILRETGFVWLKQKKKKAHKFEKISKLVSYDNEVTGYVETNRIKRLTGVKAKELLIWITLTEIHVDDPPTGKITFRTPAGLSRSYPVDAFELPEEPTIKDKTEDAGKDKSEDAVKEENKKDDAGKEENKKEDAVKDNKKEDVVKDNKKEDVVKDKDAGKVADGVKDVKTAGKVADEANGVKDVKTAGKVADEANGVKDVKNAGKVADEAKGVREA